MRAVLESCVRMCGWVLCRMVRPRIVASISAVLMLDVPVPIWWGTYVTRARSGMVGRCCHVVELSKGIVEQSMAQRTAAAVMMGVCVIGCCAVYPPSTAIISGDWYLWSRWRMW